MKVSKWVSKWLSKWTNSLLAVMAILVVSGCSRVTVEPAQVGKVLSPSGYSNEVLKPGKYTLGMREDLVVLDTSTNTYKEPIKAILSDKLTLTFDVRFRGRIRKDTKILNSMFNDITHGGDYKVTFTDVYSIYGKAAVRNKAREIISKYTVEDVHKNYSRISAEVQLAVLGALESTPIELSDVALGDIRYPDLVTKAVEEAKSRQMQIEREKNQAKIDLLKKENELKLIQADYEIEMTKARTISDYNKEIGKGITPQLLELKRIEVSKTLATHAKDSSTVYIPVEGLTSTGASVRMFNK